MKNLKLLFPGFASSCCLMLIITCGLTFISNAQEFVDDWAAYQRGPQGSIMPILAVNPENGDSYVLEKRYGTAPLLINYWNIIKYDDGGRMVWTLRYVEGAVGFLDPETIVFKNGAVFVLGTVGIEPKEPWYRNGAAVVKIIDRGDSGSQSWTQSFLFTTSGHCFVNALVADPVGSGVIFAGSGPDASTPGRDEMRIVKINGEAGSTIWSRTYDIGFGSGHSHAIGPRMIATDRVGNVYVTGVTRDAPIPVPEPSTSTPRSLFAIMYNSSGDFQWINKISASDYLYEGYDIAADGTGVYVLGQKSYLDRTRHDGFVTVTKFNLSGSPEPLWHHEIPGRVTTELDRKTLAVDPVSSSVYVTYDSEARHVVKVEKFDASGLLQWSRDLRGTDEYMWAEALRLDVNGRLIIGTNSGSREPRPMYTLYAYDTDGGDFIDEITVHRRYVTSMILDGEHRVHIMGNVFTPPYPDTKFAAQYSFTDPAPPIPDLVRKFERLDIDLFRLRDEECWTGLGIGWHCFMPPFCYDPQVQVVMSNEGKAVWDTKFTKPLDAQLPSSKDFRTFSLLMMDDNAYREVLHIDDNLAKAGVTEIHLVTDSKDLSLSLEIKTNGVDVPVTLSFLNKKGVVIGESKFIAPFNETLSDKFSEPVGSISLGSQQQMSLGYYPNPSSGEFKVSLDKATKLPAELSIYDMAGLKIYHDVLTTHEASVSIGKAKEGLYILQVKSDAGESRALIQIR